MRRPALLLDVDGVLCPFGGECPSGYSPHYFENEGGFVYVAPANTERLERLAKKFDLVWCTGWGESANLHLLDLHGLSDPLPVIEFGTTINFEALDPTRHRRMPVGSWKLPWVVQWGANRRPFAWVDDEIGEDDRQWAEARTAAGIPTLVLKTDPTVGLTDDHVQELEAWHS